MCAASADDDLEKIYKHQEEELKSEKRNWMRSDKAKYGGAITAVFGVGCLVYCFLAYAGAERNYPVRNVDLSELMPCAVTGMILIIVGLLIYIFIKE